MTEQERIMAAIALANAAVAAEHSNVYELKGALTREALRQLSLVRPALTEADSLADLMGEPRPNK